MHQCLLSISIKFFLQTFWQKFSHRASETANVGLAAGVPEALWDFIFPLHWSKCISLYFMKILTRLETNKDFFPYIHKNLHFWKGYYNPCSRNWLFPLADVTCDPIFIEIYILFYFRTFLISLFDFLRVRNINQYFRKMKYVPSFNSLISNINNLGCHKNNKIVKYVQQKYFFCLHPKAFVYFTTITVAIGLSIILYLFI